jgi:hypothetical protein
MSSKSKVTVNINTPKRILENLDTRLKKDIGKSVVADIKESLNRGDSPVEGKGRLAPYKDVKKYPSKKLREEYAKKRSPVNLKLTGDLWEAFTFKLIGASQILIGVFDKHEAAKLVGLQTGELGTHGKTAPRPVIPQAGETFKARIIRNVMRILRQRVRSVIAKTKK